MIFEQMEDKNGVAMVRVTTMPCIVCGKESQIEAPFEAVTKWRKGELIQRALPMLSVEEREMLINGTHPNCFDQLFDENEED